LIMMIASSPKFEKENDEEDESRCKDKNVRVVDSSEMLKIYGVK